MLECSLADEFRARAKALREASAHLRSPACREELLRIAADYEARAAAAGGSYVRRL
ncbi:MAG TPA: hypothetical protein VGC35_13975 [Allosphingosinicella sp.]|jgi:hypothetical protein